MAQNSKIEWTDHTVNMWWGCSKVHSGCKNCYAETLSKRFGDSVWGEKQPRKRIKSAFNDLGKYQQQAEKKDVRLKVFMGSMMDIFEDSKPLINPVDHYNTTSDLRCRLFAEIEHNSYPNLIFLFLTKRPENILKYLPEEIKYRDQLWFGTSVSDAYTVRYAKVLTSLGLKNTFVSLEPQLGPIETGSLISLLTGIKWLIQGGESGPKKRPFDIEWAYAMKEACEAMSVPYFFKQIDKVQPIPEDLMIREFPQEFI